MTKQKMSSEEVVQVAIAALEEVKGADILTIDVREKTSIADYMLICTGTSNRQLNALVDNVRDKVKAAGLKSLSEEGKGDSDWVLLDLGDVIVHVMTAAARQFYDLERLWKGAELSRAASAAHHTPGNE
ncbi:ribosome silencing factor [Pseudomonas syringae pv. actinidiae]|nr:MULTISPECIES: ribosome silencing factor [Pseudomonas syringae group]EPN55124.1 iojap domain-containing protein [Pseudomonas syringae pv. actinidiae ICMP 19079]EPN86715.1 iojap domain-containing protein [Pseudomonas syringae pv. actinidiae ICMP 19101]AKT28859.1 ribosome-associated protein IOJAP [Pseudomonas syringae pv. actinidiae ICMP 18884]AOE55373.1 ribosome silencing factor [Pseudomonas syringae pv. actinidiae ICMP 18708]APP96233.1 ribosome silencing factor [Pseudomonas syringae pv. acti